MKIITLVHEASLGLMKTKFLKHGFITILVAKSLANPLKMITNRNHTVTHQTYIISTSTYSKNETKVFSS